LSYAVALSYPQKINRVVALSGYLNQDILKEGYQKNDFSRLDFFVSHGSADQVIPVEWARKPPEILDHRNIQNVYFEYPIGHGVANKNLVAFRKL